VAGDDRVGGQAFHGPGSAGRSPRGGWAHDPTSPRRMI
jgi:hypothetical protein